MPVIGVRIITWLRLQVFFFENNRIGFGIEYPVLVFAYSKNIDELVEEDIAKKW